MNVTALPDASRRTKSRVVLLTSNHEIVSWSRGAVEGQPSALFRSARNNDWFGWLPWAEIRVEGVEFGDAF